MAIFHCTAKMISRGTGRSAVGAAAYRAGEKLTNAYDGLTHDYSRKKGVVHSEILLPKHAPSNFETRANLWNAAELAEKSSRAQVAREIETALPRELSQEENIELVREYVQKNFVNAGMCADIAIHDKGDGNPHAHIMLTTRPLNTDGSWGQKSHKEYILGKDGNRIKLPSGEGASRKINTTNWNDKETLVKWRKNWAETINIALDRKGFSARVDHRSYDEQGIKRTPTKHIGMAARHMAQRHALFNRGNMIRKREPSHNK